MDKSRAQILCVDDEPNVLEGLSMHLKRSYEVFCATSGAAALDILRDKTHIAVVISDMRMPGMDGAAFLAKARVVAPLAVRILLTGQTELEAAVAAVNEGQIFRFLTKPCPPPVLLRAVEASVDQHKLLSNERALLEHSQPHHIVQAPPSHHHAHHHAKEHVERSSSTGSSRSVSMVNLRVGMVFAEDVRSVTGILLAARGFEVTDGFIDRVRNLRAGSVPEFVQIV